MFCFFFQHTKKIRVCICILIDTCTCMYVCIGEIAPMKKLFREASNFSLLCSVDDSSSSMRMKLSYVYLVHTYIQYSSVLV